MSEYLLLGEKLSHSLSPEIHRMLGNPDYSLAEMPRESLPDFFAKRDFNGLNVTVPYKKDAFAACDELSETARTLGSVNTVVKRPDGTLFGDNTDFFGFSYLLDRAEIDVKDKKCLVIGNGGAAATVCAVLKERGGRVKVITHSENNEAGLSPHFCDTEIVLNTSPVGMFPNCDGTPVELHRFSSLYAAVDLIYNPRRTNFILEAADMGILYSGGLPMLAAQAVRSDEIFFGKKRSGDIIEAIIEHIEQRTSNVVLVGMPGCGKTTVGKLVAQRSVRRFTDIDEEIEKSAGKSIPEIFSEVGESGFRRLEAEAIASFCGKLSGAVISTGGGSVLLPENIMHMRRNGIVFFIERPTNELATEGRPLSDPETLGKMYDKRLPLYKKAADYTVSGASAGKAADRICAILSDLGV